MSRPELADAVNTALDRLYPHRDLAAQYVDFRWIGKLERGEHRWPSHERRAALRHVLRAATDTQLGLYSPRRTHTTTSATYDQSIDQAHRPDFPYGSIPPPGPELSVDSIRRQPDSASAVAEPWPETGSETVTLLMQLDGNEVVMPLSRRLLLQAGIGTFVEAFALGHQLDTVRNLVQRPSPTRPPIVKSPAHLHEILSHLRHQWHALVKTDNLLGPRFALAGVLTQITVLEAISSALRDEQRLDAVRLAARYAESAAWLHEDIGNMERAQHWTFRAMEWAYESDDQRMLAWTIFRRSQQAAAKRDAAQAIGLAQAARRDEERLAPPTRAAILVQEAYGQALDGNERAAQRLLDDAHAWAASDIVGDAQAGHGSYCTPGHIETQRANCWLTNGKPKKAIALYEQGLRTLPPVYQRNRAASLSRLAMAYAVDGQLEQAASTAHAALPVAHTSGSRRILDDIRAVGATLAPHRRLPAVAALLDDLNGGNQ